MSASRTQLEVIDFTAGMEYLYGAIIMELSIGESVPPGDDVQYLEEAEKLLGKLIEFRKSEPKKEEQKHESRRMVSDPLVDMDSESREFGSSETFSTRDYPVPDFDIDYSAPADGAEDHTTKRPSDLESGTDKRLRALAEPVDPPQGKSPWGKPAGE